jgi:hypothetical protein
LIDGPRHVLLPFTKTYIYPKFQVTVRPNTYELFWREYSQHVDGADGSTYYIAPPEFKDIVDTITKSTLFLNEDGSIDVERAEIFEFFANVQTSLCRSLSLQRRQLNGLFMQNVRYRMNFTRNVLEEMFRPVLNVPDIIIPDMSRAGLVVKLRHETRELPVSKDYRLVDMLLHAKNERFANFIRIEGAGIDLQRHKDDPTYIQTVLRDNNVKSGYVGNVFNYHIPYSDHSDIEFLLEKVRILDLLISSGGEPLQTDELKRIFIRNGWNPSPYFDFSVAILIRENMIAGFNIEAGANGYVATEFGRMTRESLVSNMIYLENVFFGTFLPRGIKRRGKDIYRSMAQRHEWVAASIFHCWILLRLIFTAEKGQHTAFFEEVRNSVAGTIERILSARSADPRIAIFALRYMNEFEEGLET